MSSLGDSLLQKNENSEQDEEKARFKSLSRDKFKVSEKRWFMILVFCILNMSNSMMWCTYSPISDLTEDFFGHVLPGNNTAVNMFTVVFYALYLPGTILGTLVTKKTNIRGLILLGGVLTAIGGVFRCLGVASISKVGPGWAYALTLFGQTLGAVANPFFMNIPASLASTWFAVDERDFATAIATMCNPFGDVIGQILPPLLVTKRDNVDDDSNAVVDGMLFLMIVEFGWTFVGLVLCYCFFDAAPPTPPSASTYLRQESVSSVEETKLTLGRGSEDIVISNDNSMNGNYVNNDSGHKRGEISVEKKTTYEHSYQRLKLEYYELFSSRDYIMLFVAISVGVGTFNSVLGLLNQIVEDYDYSNGDAGWFGAILVASGMFFAGIAGYIMDKTHAYRECLRYCFILATLSLVFLLAMIYHNNFGWLCVASAALGTFSVGLSPFAIEMCAEITYPISEDTSVGMLLVGSNYAGIFITFIVQELLNQPALGPPPLLPSSIFMITMLVISVLAVYSFKGEYKRLYADQNN